MKIKFKNKISYIFIFIFIILVFTPNNYKADSKWMSKEECNSLNGKITKGPVATYETYEVKCKLPSGETKTTFSKDGNCSSGILVSSTPRRFTAASPGELSRVTGYPASSFTKVSDDQYCCEYGNSCKIEDGKFYGKNGNVVSYSQFLEECAPKPDPIEPEPPKEEDCNMPNDPVNKPVSCSTQISQELGCGGTMEEPELCGVIGAQSQDYKAGGNDYCEIYCRKELKLTFQEKVEVLAGRYFKHSLTGKSQIQNLSGVIKGEYECGGQVKYYTWKKKFKTANENLISAWNDYSYWHTVVNRAPQIKETVNGVCEECDLDCSYWYCSEGKPNEECGIALTKKEVFVYAAKQEKTLTFYKAKPTNYIPSNCTANCEFTSADCEYPTSTASYESGKQEYSCSCSGTKCVLEDGIDANVYLSKAKSAYESAVEEIKKLIRDIEECNKPENYAMSQSLIRTVSACGGDNTTTGGYDENSVFNEGYKVNIEDYQDSEKQLIEKKCNISGAWSDFCGNCDADFQGTGCQTETLVRYECTGEPGVGKCTNITYTAPKNSAVYAKTADESNHYQNVEFSTQIFTGNIMEGIPNSSYIPMESNIWPVGINRKNGTYDICYEVKVEDEKNHFDDGELHCEYDVVNEVTIYDCNDGYETHECYECPDGEDCYNCPDGEDCDLKPGDFNYSFGVYFRSVNLDDLFPNSKFSKYSVPITSERKIGYNWKNSEAVVKAIQSIDNIWSPDYLDYSVTLTPTAIRNIKQYNKSAENYLDNSLNCDNSLFCSSKFLSNKLNELGVTNIYINNDTFTESRYTKPVGGNS